MTTFLSIKIITLVKVAILLIGISAIVNSNRVYAETEQPTESKQIPAFVYETQSTNKNIIKGPSATKAEMDAYTIEVRESLLKDFNELNEQIDNHNPENATKILSTVMELRILEIENEIKKLGFERNIQIWKKRFSFTKKTKSKYEAKILLFDEKMSKHSKEYYIIQQFLTEAEKDENEKDETKKINHKINSI
jgi:hypothetical protein